QQGVDPRCCTRKLGDPLFPIIFDQHFGMGAAHAAGAGNELPFSFIKRFPLKDACNQRLRFLKGIHTHEWLFADGKILVEAGRHPKRTERRSPAYQSLSRGLMRDGRETTLIMRSPQRSGMASSIAPGATMSFK